MKTVELMSAANNFEAEIVKGLLKSEGIDCIFVGSNTSIFEGAIPGFGVRILVDERDFAKAKELLESNEGEDSEESEESE